MPVGSHNMEPGCWSVEKMRPRDEVSWRMCWYLSGSKGCAVKAQWWVKQYMNTVPHILQGTSLLCEHKIPEELGSVSHEAKQESVSQKREPCVSG